VQLTTLRRMPKSETSVRVTTVVAVVVTHNLAIGVGLGVVVAMALFARRVAHFATVERRIVDALDGTQSALYTVDGELFFASSNDLTTQFQYRDDPEYVVIDLSRSHIWDASTVAALDAITTKYERYGKSVEIIDMNDESSALHGRLAGHLGAGH